MNFVVIIASLVGLIIFSLFSPENASALKPVAEITSVTTYNGEPVKDGAIIRSASGAFTEALRFQFRGFDDNDHIIELRCSWDGINYLKNSCPQGVDEQEYRQSFEGPDGVIRDYYYKSQSFTRAFQLTPTLVSYIFGVKVLNDNNELSPAATFTFKLLRSPNVGSEETAPASKPYKSQVKVQLNSITVHNDHDGFWRGKGDFINYAFVQGHRLVINTHIDSGDTVYFKPDKQITVFLEPEIPLSIFTVGNEEDCNVKLEPILPPQYLTELGQIFKDPKLDWSKAVSDAQSEIFKEYLKCDGDKLGFINTFILPPDYKSWLTPEQIARYQESPFLRILLPSATGPDFAMKSSTEDFTLKFTVSVE
jgi:hypothetical protein